MNTTVVQAGSVARFTSSSVLTRRRPIDDRARKEARRLVVVCFGPLLLAAFLARLTGWRWQPWPPAAESRQSVVREAWDTAETVVGLSL